MIFMLLFLLSTSYRYGRKAMKKASALRLTAGTDAGFQHSRFHPACCNNHSFYAGITAGGRLHPGMVSCRLRCGGSTAPPLSANVPRKACFPSSERMNEVYHRFSGKASVGLSAGGLLNIALDPLFMFVLLPKGSEVIGAALATLLSNIASSVYLLHEYRKATIDAPLSLKMNEAREISRQNVKQILSVGVPSAMLTGLFDLANICVNMLASAHSDLVLAGMGIVMKVERIPTAINLGICQGAMPVIAYNYSSGDHRRMEETIRTARLWGLTVAGMAGLSPEAGCARVYVTSTRLIFAAV